VHGRLGIELHGRDRRARELTSVTEDRPEPSGAVGGWRGRIGTLAGCVAVLVLLFALGEMAGGWVGEFRERVAGLGPLGPLVFVLGYTLGVLAFVPGAALTLAGGALFGVGWGTVWSFVGAVLGSSAAFLAGRHGARASVESWIVRDPRFAAVDRACAAQGGRIAFLLRLSPVFPFNVLNYALGLTGIGFRPYTWASLGMLPGTLLYAWVGSLGVETVELAGGSQSPVRYSLHVVGLLATLGLTVLVARQARRAVAEATAGSPPRGSTTAETTPR
jgi:uncharacterized membrane protein YdjX (TVP38/TMEM64 family)